MAGCSLMSSACVVAVSSCVKAFISSQSSLQNVVLVTSAYTAAPLKTGQALLISSDTVMLYKMFFVVYGLF